MNAKQRRVAKRRKRPFEVTQAMVDDAGTLLVYRDAVTVGGSLSLERLSMPKPGKSAKFVFMAARTAPTRVEIKP